jgi:CRP-like cAMP-binding protein
MIRSRVFDGLSPEEYDRILCDHRLETRKYSRGEIVINEGEPVKNIGILHLGKLVGVKINYEGMTHLLRTFEPGEAMLIEAYFSSFGTSPMTIIADEESDIVILPSSIFESPSSDRIAERLFHNMFRILADESIKLIYKTEILSKRSLRERIMSYLLIMQEKRGKNSFQILMNQEKFAQYLCVNRSALSYELNLMKREGIIAYSKDQYTILNGQ